MLKILYLTIMNELAVAQLERLDTQDLCLSKNQALNTWNI